MSNIFAKGNPAFRDLHYTMDSLYRRLRAEGVGAEKHSAEPFTKEDKNKLWKLEIMGTHSPTSLQWAVFFYNGEKNQSKMVKSTEISNFHNWRGLRTTYTQRMLPKIDKGV